MKSIPPNTIFFNCICKKNYSCYNEIMIVDLHIHSRFAYATSPQITLPQIHKWAKIKGINVISTADFTHPTWFNEIEKHLEPAEKGLFKLKHKYKKEVEKDLPQTVKKNTCRFMLTTEISNIYSKNDKTHKLHNLILVPSLKVASELIAKLSNIGNLKADGRPILGMDSQKLLEMTLNISDENFFIPAHIWTPWFSMFGSKSGFDSIEEAFGDLSEEIKAIETGLSSDPFMNWRLKELKNLTIVSNSDAHSLQKLGREANILDCGLNYQEIINTLKTNDKRMIGTIEFYPQEGKYHYDGHRKCHFSCSPEEAEKLDNICPKCEKPLVIGVMHRVHDLADHSEDYQPKKHKNVEYIIPLAEVIGEIKGIKSAKSKTVMKEYHELIKKFGSEFTILRKTPIQDLQKENYTQLAEAIHRLRSRNIIVKPGYDGVYGKIKVFKDEKDKNKIT